MTKASILIVEDEPIVAMDLFKTLESFGYRSCGIASTGREAIDMADELRPDLILMDIRLRDQMDGVQAAQEIQKRFLVPILFLTAHSDDSTLEKAKAIGPFGYVLKPFNEFELRSAIQAALAKKKTS